MSEHWRSILEHIPFLAAAVRPDSGDGKINYTRVVEALLIAGMTALATSYQTAEKVSTRLDERIAALTVRMDRAEREIAENRERAIRAGEKAAEKCLYTNGQIK